MLYLYKIEAVNGVYKTGENLMNYLREYLKCTKKADWSKQEKKEK